MRMPGGVRSLGCLPRSPRWKPPILDWATTTPLERDKTWYEQRLGVVEDRIRDRLCELSVRLGDADWLDGAISAGDLLMVAALLRLKASSGIYTGGISEPLRLCRPRRSAARLQACFRRSIGGCEGQATDRLITVRSALTRALDGLTCWD